VEKLYNNWHQSSLTLSTLANKILGKLVVLFLRILTIQATTYLSLFLYGEMPQHSAIRVTNTSYFFQQYYRALFVYKGREPTQSSHPRRINHPLDRDSWKSLCNFLEEPFPNAITEIYWCMVSNREEISWILSLFGCYGRALYSDTCALSLLVN